MSRGPGSQTPSPKGALRTTGRAQRPSLACSILAEPYAGLQAQARGLAEAADLSPTIIDIVPRAPWSWVSARLWPNPLRAVPIPAIPDGPILAAGGTSAVIAARLRTPTRPIVQIQHPRLDPARFDVIVVNRHDGLTGPNVIVTRTALHAATPARLAAAAAAWTARLAHLPRPLVTVLIGGSNGRFRLDAPVARHLATQLAQLMTDGAGIALTPSRRTSPEARAAFAPLADKGAYLWDGTGENPYFALLALADAIVVTEDSVSMVSEAVATSAPVLLAPLPGRSRRIRLFNHLLIQDGRIRPFTGRLDLWPTTPLDDTPQAGEQVRHRLDL